MIAERDAAGRVTKSLGRIKGSKNRRPSVLAMLPPDALQQLYTRLFELALAGDAASARLLLDRIDPPLKGRPVPLPDVPLPIDGLPAAQVAARKVVEAMVGGELSPAEAAETIGVITQQVTTVEARDWGRMLEELLERSRR